MRSSSPSPSPATMRIGLPVLQIDRPPAFQPAGADLRPAQVLEDGHNLRRARGGRANPVERLGVRFVRAVGEIEPADVDAGVDELLDDLVAATCRADRGDDFCVPHVRDSLHRNEARRTITRACTKMFADSAKRVLVDRRIVDDSAPMSPEPRWRQTAC